MDEKHKFSEFIDVEAFYVLYYTLTYITFLKPLSWWLVVSSSMVRQKLDALKSTLEV